MIRQITITTEYFRQYRQKLGFSNQADVKNFFGAKDIMPTVDFNYIDLLNKRLYEIVDRLNKVVIKEIKIDDLKTFRKEYIDQPLKIMKENDILPQLNNQGRRPENVYYNWMRGYVISNYFLKALGIIFGVQLSSIDLIGEDDLKNIDVFKRGAKADLEIQFKNGEKIRIEMQSGYSGANDIKQSKVFEAKRVFSETGVHTMAVHLDLYNGQVAFVMLDSLEEVGEHWITRPQFEGAMVFEIEQNYFIWKITESPIKYKNMKFD